MNFRFRFIAALVAVMLVLGIVPVNFAIADGNHTVIEITDKSGIAKTGLPSSDVYTKSGSFTMKWAGADLYRKVKLPLLRNDFTNGNYLEFWVYSAKKTNTDFTLGLISDDKFTACTDYYHASITIDWEGWKLISLELENDFDTAYTPKGFGSVDEAWLWPEFGAKSIGDEAELYFDNFSLCAQRTAVSGDEEENLILMLEDFSDLGVIASYRLPASTSIKLNGNASMKYQGPGKSLVIRSVPSDWMTYSALVINIYSEKITNESIYIAVMSENDTTDGMDYYLYTLNINWTGWKTCVAKIGKDNKLPKNKSPLGMDCITGLEVWSGYSGMNITSDTVLYFDSMYLSTNIPKDESNTPVTDYILEAKTEASFYDAIGALTKNHPNQSHPRLLFNKEELNWLLENVDTDMNLKKAKENIIATANKALDEAVLTYGTPDGKRLPRTAPDMMPPLSLAYLLTKDVRYKDRLWAEIESVSDFPDWNPSHFLDVGDYARGMSYAYDWLYDEWDESQRRTMRNAMVRNAFGAALPQLRGKTGYSVLENNWNEVINAGVGLAALAFGDEPGYEAMCNEVINRTVSSLPIGLEYFAPDGVCNEGPSYWTYAQQTFQQYDCALFGTLGTDYGLSDLPGMSNTAFWAINVCGPSGTTFNFGDTSNGQIIDPCIMWMSRRYNKPELASYIIKNTKEPDSFFFAFYRGGDPEVDYTKDLPLNVNYEALQEMAIMRTTWDDKTAMWVAVKGGYNAFGHNDLDLGDFVFDSSGVRWFAELSSDYYEAPGMWEYGPEGGRWKYYRKNTEGQNTVVVNPGDKPMQNVYAKAPIEVFEYNDAASYAIVDLDDAYQDYASSVKRGIGLVNNKSVLIVQDEIKTKSPSEAYSFFHTTAEIEIAADKKSAILTLAKNKLKAVLLGDGELLSMKSEALPTSADPGYPQYSNDHTRKLAVHVKNATNPTLSVMFYPYSDSMPEPQIELRPLSNWDEYLKISLSLNSLMVDGVELMDFEPGKTSYRISTGISGEVSAEADDGIDVTVIQDSETTDASAYVIAENLNENIKTVYSIDFTPSQPRLFDEVKSYEIKNVEASETAEEKNPPEHSVDGDYSTRWAANGKQWIRYDLGEIKPVAAVRVSFMNGHTRMANISIDLSEDGNVLKRVFEGMSGGKTSNLEEFSFEQTNARYIYINVDGTNTGTWNSLQEVVIPEVCAEFEDVKNHWAADDIKLLTDIGMINGVSDIYFSPDSTVTRAEFIAMAVRAAQFDKVEYENGIPDVQNSDWYASDIATALHYGILPDAMLNGGNFEPEKEITREEMAVVLVNVYEKSTNKRVSDESKLIFTDINQISDFAVSAVKKGVLLRLIKGTTPTTFTPRDNATRAQAAVMIKRLLTQIAD